MPGAALGDASGANEEFMSMKQPKRTSSRHAVGPDALLQALEPGADEALLRQALAHAHYRPVAQAAGLVADALHYALEPALMEAFRRFAALDHKRDPGCIAKGALARALVALDSLDAAFFREGIKLRQLEPTWGESVDTAGDVRASCAMGLAASGDTGALLDLVDLLVDPEHRARIGAVRAIGCTEPRAASAVLRTKALLGDAEPEVTGECFRALLAVDADGGPDFVARWLDGAGGGAGGLELAELAALALGESRLDAAVAALRARWEAEPFRRPWHQVLLRAAALARSDAALDWLLGLAADADAGTARQVVEVLAVNRHQRRVADALRARLAARGDAALLAAFRAEFRDAAAADP
jgi:hypothetical protein